MIPVSSVAGSGLVGAETYVFAGDRRAWAGGRTGVLWCHEAGGSPKSNYAERKLAGLLHSLAGRYATLLTECGGTLTFGNDTAMTAMDDAVDALVATWDTPSRVILAGASMGGCNALNYALRHPEKVAAVALIVPALNLTDLHANNRGGLTAAINAAYGGAYSSVTHGPTRSPVQFAGDLDPDLPIHFWTSSDDPICLPQFVADFLAARPQTEASNLGAHGHSWDGIPPAVSDMRQWLREVAG